MPSPIGHALAGIAAGTLVWTQPAGSRRDRWRDLAIFAALALSPDLDLLIGAHSGPTHSVGATVIVGLVAWVVSRRAGVARSLPFAIACAAAYGSHVLLDWLARDTTPPIGVMALWPFSHNHYESDLHLFMAISRRYHQGWPFIAHNATALVRELLILTPIVALVTIVKSRRRTI